jgi:hypothetical protein
MRGFITTAAALTAAAAFAAPAGAAVNGSHVVAVIPEPSTLELSGYSPGAHLTVEVSRNNTLIGTAITDADQQGAAGVNPVACWQGTSSPQILPGDVVSVAGDGATDTMTVQDVNATSLEIDALTGNILVHGYARTLGGARLDPATFDADIQARVTAPKGVSFSNGRRTIRAGATKTDGTVAYDGPTGTTWTATFPPKGDDAALAQNATNFEGAYLIGLSELTIGRLPVTAGGCAPIQRNGVSSFDRGAVNASNVASPLVVSGVTQPDATSVSVTVTDDTGKASAPVTVTPVNGTWTAPAIPVSGFADGTLTAHASITVPATATTSAQTFDGNTQSIAKDVVVPPAPVASPGGGTFTGTKLVSLGDDDSSAKVHYTVAGTLPGAGSPTFVAAPIAVDHSLTIRAVAIDAAGNRSAEGDFAFTILSPPVVVPQGGGGGGAGPTNTTIIQQVPFVIPLTPSGAVAGTHAASPARPAVRGLAVTALRGHALRVTMRLGSGAHVVRLRVLRASGGAALLTALRPTLGGRVTITLRGRALRALKAGSYVLEARAGASRSALGAATRRAFRVH